MTAQWFCALCGRERKARRCGCQGATKDTTPNMLVPPGVHVESMRLLTRAQFLREAASKHEASAAANLEDAERLEKLALQGRA